ncbi:MAG: SDR family oxidoreductase [Chloroflexi bacterium]|nr:SDR family oxidoreductase [Chloroflexota bacterium]
MGGSSSTGGVLTVWHTRRPAELGQDAVGGGGGGRGDVNTVLPGRIKTVRLGEIDAATAARQSVPVEEIVRDSKTAIPMGRYDAVEEYAGVCVFLMSARASYVTGAVLRIDGGYIRGV